jgi:hypothetical protein
VSGGGRVDELAAEPSAERLDEDLPSLVAETHVYRNNGTPSYAYVVPMLAVPAPSKN